MSRGGAKREGKHRIRCRFQALSCQHRPWCRAQTHGPWDHGPSWSQTLNRLTDWATQVPLKILLIYEKRMTGFQETIPCMLFTSCKFSLNHLFSWNEPVVHQSIHLPPTTLCPQYAGCASAGLQKDQYDMTSALGVYGLIRNMSLCPLERML